MHRDSNTSGTNNDGKINHISEISDDVSSMKISYMNLCKLKNCQKEAVSERQISKNERDV